MNGDAPVAQLDRALPSEGKGHTFESCRVRHFGTKLGTPKPAVFAPEAQKRAFRSHDAQFFLIDFDALGERAEVVAAVAAAIDPQALAGRPGKRLEGLWCDGRAGAINRVLGPLCVKAGL